MVRIFYDFKEFIYWSSRDGVAVVSKGQNWLLHGDRNQSRINAYIDSNGNIKNIDGYNAAVVRAEKNSYENLIQSGKTPEQIIKSAIKGKPAMDACTGLYDAYFNTY